jgi:hypothetical protein
MQKTAHLALSTRIKDGLNAVLKIAGLQVSTTKLDRLEQARLEKLVAHEHWAAAPFQDGLCFEPDCYFNFLRTVCAPYAPDWGSFPSTADAVSNGYFSQNGWFESIGAEVLYSVVRHFRPRTILEIDGGHSSRLARRAIDDGQLGTRLVCVDPSPRVEVRSCADEHIQSAVEDLPLSGLTQRLGANDVLFIDSSHVITSGGDVPYLYLQVLPRLSPGVLVHAHDIFLPFEYPQEFVVKKRWGWNEQYLLHALLIGNSGLEITWPSCYMWQLHRAAVQNVIPSERSSPPPSSFWMVKKCDVSEGGI